MTIRRALPAFSALFMFPLVNAAGQNTPTQGQPQAPTYVQQTCPTISVSCPSHVDVGEPLWFTASIGGGNPSATPTYKWEVVGGVITEGQGTPAIIVTKVGPAGQGVTATLYVGGLDTACGKTASCSTPGAHLLPTPTKFDSYGVLPLKKEKAILDRFGAALQQQPGAQGYIFGYGARRSRAGEAQRAADRAKEYLVNKLGIDEGRITTLDGGIKEQPTVDLWLVPMGATPPPAEPTVDPTEVNGN